MIRAATAGDAERIALVHVRSWQAAYRGMMPQEHLDQTWGQGLGRDLMTAALRSLTAFGYQAATLWVLKENSRARQFYEAAGFNADGAEQTEDVAGSPITEIRYRRILSPL